MYTSSKAQVGQTDSKGIRLDIDGDLIAVSYEYLR